MGAPRSGRTDPNKEPPVPEHLSALVSDILRLDVLKEAGATFSYPDALSPLQWVGLEALTNARRRHQEKDHELRQREQDRQASMAKLHKLSHGG